MKIYVFLVIVSFSTLNAQIDTTLKEYFPMQIGNVWEYYTNAGDIYHIKVIGDTIMPNGLKYAVFWDSLQFEGSGDPFLYYYRIDDSMNVRIYPTYPFDSCDGDWIMFKLNIKDSTFWKECRYPALGEPEYNFPCLAWTKEKYFWTLGLTSTTKTFCGAVIDTMTNDTTFCGSFYYMLYELSKGIGITRTAGEMAAHVYINGAIINGVRYGEITGITGTKNKIDEFELYQNYPNPFNPTTKIKYKIKTSSMVTLKVFNTLGQQIAVLINEYKTAGIYNVEFDMKKYEYSFPSGVYYYKITAGDFIDTKKMVLSK